MKILCASAFLALTLAAAVAPASAFDARSFFDQQARASGGK